MFSFYCAAHRENVGYSQRWPEATWCSPLVWSVWWARDFKPVPLFWNVPVPANLVLEDTVERIYHGNAYAENWHGLFLIRGENVVLLGEIVSKSVDSHRCMSCWWCRGRILTQRMKHLYGVSNTMSWSHTTRMISMSRRSTKTSSHRFCSSRKDFAGKEERGMGIDTMLSNQRWSTIAKARLIHSAIKAPDINTDADVLLREWTESNRTISWDWNNKRCESCMVQELTSRNTYGKRRE